MSPNTSSDSVIYTGTIEAKKEPKAENDNENNEVNAICQSIGAMNLDAASVQRKCIVKISFQNSIK